MDELPFVDKHTVEIPVRRGLVWDALLDYHAHGLGADPLLARVLGTRPPKGFAIADRVDGERLELAGRHRFSRYRLVFELAGDTVTTVSALTYAAFPGVHGRAYRLLVIRSGAHVVATRGILRSVRERSLRRGR